MTDPTIEKFIFGRQPVLEAINSGQELDRVLISFNASGSAIHQIMKAANNAGIQVRKVQTNKFAVMASGNKNHQGVIGVINSFKYMDLDRFLLELNKENAGLLVLDHIEDPHNLGAIIRTAEGAGIKAVIIPDRKAARINDTVVKTSAGAVFHIPVIRTHNLGQVLDILKESGFFVFGTSVSAEKYYYEVNFNLPFVLVIGNEGSGISKMIQKKCDENLKIPQLGKVNSLNASVSAAILIFEAVRQRISI